MFVFIKQTETNTFGISNFTFVDHKPSQDKDESIQPDNSYQRDGNKISIKALDLNRNFSEIATQLNAIVADLF